MYAVLVLALTLLSSQVHGIVFTDCGSAQGSIRGAQITGCEGKDRCPLPRGTTPTISISFTSKEDTGALHAVVHGVIAGIPMPFPLPQPNACEKSGIACPVTSGSNYTYAQTLPVRKSYPPLEVDVKWELKDANNNNVICCLIPCQVV